MWRWLAILVPIFLFGVFALSERRAGSVERTSDTAVISATPRSEPGQSNRINGVLPPETTLAAEPSSPPPSPLLQSRRVLNADNPYPELIALHQRGGPGDYAVVRTFILECSMALQAVNAAKEAGLLQGIAVPSMASSIDTSIARDSHASRVAALQNIEMRCGPVLSDARLHEPHARDEYGKRLKQNRAAVLEGAGQQAKLLKELRDQNSPFADGVVQPLLIQENIRRLSGLSKESHYYALFALAAHSLQIDPGRAGGSIRSLSACVSFGVCDGSIEKIPLDHIGIPYESPLHRRMIELVPVAREALTGKQASRED